MSEQIDWLYDNRSDPETRAVLEDWERTRYRTSTVARLGYALSFIHADAADADADAAAAAAADAADADDAAAAADADAADADDDAAAAAADADDDAAAADADADADAAADADIQAIRSANRALTEEPDMSPGLKIVQIQITNWRAITFIGWLRRVSGDEYEFMPGARIITRKSGYADWNGVDNLAAKGPGSKYQLSEPMVQPEELHRLRIGRSKPADEKVWAKHCPRPKDWSER